MTTTREKIVEAAAALLNEGGRAAISTRAVSAAAGVQAPTIYRIFGDKQGLLDAVASHGFVSYLGGKMGLGHSEDPVEDLRRGWDLHVAFGLEHPAVYTLIYGEPRPGVESPAARAAAEVLAGQVRRIAAAGRLRVSEERAAHLIHAAGCGMTLTLIALPPELRDPALPVLARESVIAAVTSESVIATAASEPAATGAPATAEAPTAEAPATTGPTTAGPTIAGPTTAGPTTAGPATAGPTTAGPTTAGPATAGPTTAEPTTVGPATVGLSTAGSGAAGPATVGPATAGLSAAGPGARVAGAVGALRVALPGVTALTGAERALLDEWLMRIVSS